MYRRRGERQRFYYRVVKWCEGPVEVLTTEGWKPAQPMKRDVPAIFWCLVSRMDVSVCSRYVVWKADASQTKCGTSGGNVSRV